LINNLEHRQIPHAPESVRPYVTMSIGIAQLSAKQDVDNYHTLLEAADDALYKAKENGRNQLAWAIEEE
jgi:diguanylate cyclase (GGDEF)-like protein